MLRLYARYRITKGVTKGLARDLGSTVLFLSALTVGITTVLAKTLVYCYKVIKFGILNCYTVTATYEE